jgi:hypothetical protein
MAKNKNDKSNKTKPGHFSKNKTEVVPVVIAEDKSVMSKINKTKAKV